MNNGGLGVLVSPWYDAISQLGFTAKRDKVSWWFGCDTLHQLVLLGP